MKTNESVARCFQQRREGAGSVANCPRPKLTRTSDDQVVVSPSDRHEARPGELRPVESIGDGLIVSISSIAVSNGIGSSICVLCRQGALMS